MGDGRGRDVSEASLGGAKCIVIKTDALHYNGL